MDVIEIPDGRIDERFERREAYPLKYSRPEEALVGASVSAAPGAGYNDDDGAEKVEMSFPPDSSRGHEDETCEPDSQEVVACQQGHVGQGALEVYGEGDGVGGEEGGEGRCYHGEEGEYGDDEVAAPEGPVLSYVSVHPSSGRDWGGRRSGMGDV